MIEEHGVREFTHRVSVAVGQHFQDAPLLDRNAFPAQPGFELAVDFPVGLGKQVSEMLGDGGGGTGRFGHG